MCRHLCLTLSLNVACPAFLPRPPLPLFSFCFVLHLPLLNVSCMPPHCLGAWPAHVAFLPPLPFGLQLGQPMVDTGRRGESWRRVGVLIPSPSYPPCPCWDSSGPSSLLGPSFTSAMATRLHPVTLSPLLFPLRPREGNGSSCCYCPGTLPPFIDSLNPALLTPV